MNNFVTFHIEVCNLLKDKYFQVLWIFWGLKFGSKKGFSVIQLTNRKSGSGVCPKASRALEPWRADHRNVWTMGHWNLFLERKGLDHWLAYSTLCSEAD